MALGAAPSRVLRMVLRESVALLCVGIAIGVLSAYAAGRVVAAMLFGLVAGRSAHVWHRCHRTDRRLRCGDVGAGPARQPHRPHGGAEGRVERSDPLTSMRRGHPPRAGVCRISICRASVPGRPQIAALVVTPAASLSIAIIFAVALNQAWGARRDRDQRIYAARGQHLQRLQTLLRTESEALSGIAGALRDGRYFTQVANDARQAVWHDDVLTADVERHFPEYSREREQLIRAILEHDREMGRFASDLSASLRLTDATEPYRIDLVSALVKKCAGASGSPVVRWTGLRESRCQPADARGGTRLSHTSEYRGTPPRVAAVRQLFDRADDLADEALQLSAAARRDAEETVLHGSCTLRASDSDDRRTR